MGKKQKAGQTVPVHYNRNKWAGDLLYMPLTMEGVNGTNCLRTPDATKRHAGLTGLLSLRTRFTQQACPRTS